MFTARALRVSGTNSDKPLARFGEVRRLFNPTPTEKLRRRPVHHIGLFGSFLADSRLAGRLRRPGAGRRAHASTSVGQMRVPRNPGQGRPVFLLQASLPGSSAVLEPLMPRCEPTGPRCRSTHRATGFGAVPGESPQYGHWPGFREWAPMSASRTL